MIQDDPAFLPDLALPGFDIDLSTLDSTTDESSRLSSVLSPHSQRSSVSSGHEIDLSMLPLSIPSSAHGGSGGRGGFDLPSGLTGSVQGSAGFGQLVGDDEDFNIDLGFAFDQEGNLVEEPTQSEQLHRLGNLGVSSAPRVGADAGQWLTEGFQEPALEVRGNLLRKPKCPVLTLRKARFPQFERRPSVARSTGFSWHCCRDCCAKCLRQWLLP